MLNCWRKVWYGFAMDFIEIDCLRLRTTIGFSAHELDAPQDIVVSLRLGVEDRLAGETDEPANAFNYRTVAKGVIALVEGARFNLVEKLAEEIARLATVEYGAPYIEVAVHKPGALRQADSAGIRIVRRLSDYASPKVYISLGSNIEPARNIVAAVRLLQRHTTVLRRSPVYRTPAQGYRAQAPFLNMAVEVCTGRSPRQFKVEVIDRIERALGRRRDPSNKNAPRTIDLDIALWNDEVLQFGEKPWKVPEPGITRFAHIALPLAQIAPDFLHPLAAVSLREIAAALDATGIEQVDLDFGAAD